MWKIEARRNLCACWGREVVGRKLTLGLAFAAVGAGLAGCTAPAPRISGPASRAYVIFNPRQIGVSPDAILRPSWPSTYASTDPGEAIRYRETIIDYQGWFGTDRDDRHYRRFQSTRWGTLRR